MLENISKILTGDLLRELCNMGHGDYLVIADANFPGDKLAGTTVAKKTIRLPGISGTDVFKAILEVFPLDINYSEHPIEFMELTPSDREKGMKDPEIWGEYKAIADKKYGNVNAGNIERMAFYEKAAKSYVIIETGEERIYGNLIITKGVIA